MQAIKSDDVQINRSGAVSYSEKNEPQSVPVHIKIEWGFVDDKSINKTTRENAVGYHLHDLRIFDNDLYNKLNNTGQKDKKKIVEKYLEENKL